MSSLGKAVLNGELTYTSPSAIKKFDVREDGGCPRAWAYRYIAGIREPTSRAQQAGIDGHGRIEHFLKTGEDVLTDIDRPGKRWMQSGEYMIVEPPIVMSRPITVIAGVPLVGKLDLGNLSNTYIDPQGERHTTDIPEVIDWKFSGDPRKWGKTAEKIRDDLAMCAYALWLLQYAPNANEIRLSHVYFCTKKADSFKRTAKITRQHAFDVVQSYAPVIEEMKRVARQFKDNPAGAPFNGGACSAYRGCFYDPQCDRPIEDHVRNMFGTGVTTPQKPEETVGLLENVDLLKEQEATERAANADVPDVLAMLDLVALYGVGMPMFAGDAAAAVTEVGGPLTGDGGLGKLTLTTIAEIEKILGELDTKFPDVKVKAASAIAKPTQSLDIPSALPPESAPPTPAEAAVPLPPERAIKLSGPVKAAAEAQAKAAEAAAPPPQEPQAKKAGRPASTDPASKYKKMKKAEVVAEAVRLEALVESAAPIIAKAAGGVPDGFMIEATLAPGDVSRVADLEARLAEAKAMNDKLRGDLSSAKTCLVATDISPRIEIWIDALPSDDLPEPLDTYINERVAEVATVGKAAHILAPPDKSPIAYGKWRGYLTAAIQSTPPAPGRYYLRVKGDEVRECVASALGGCDVVVHRGL